MWFQRRWAAQPLLVLLQESGIPEAKQYAGFRLGGVFPVYHQTLKVFARPYRQALPACRRRCATHVRSATYDLRYLDGKPHPVLRAFADLLYQVSERRAPGPIVQLHDLQQPSGRMRQVRLLATWVWSIIGGRSCLSDREMIVLDFVCREYYPEANPDGLGI